MVRSAWYVFAGAVHLVATTVASHASVIPNPGSPNEVCIDVFANTEIFLHPFPLPPPPPDPPPLFEISRRVGPAGPIGFRATFTHLLGEWRTSILEPPPDPWIPFGGSVVFSPFGTVNGGPVQSLGALTFSHVGPGLMRLSADYAAVSSPTQLVEVYDGGMLVASIPSFNGTIDFFNTAPSVLGKFGGALPGGPLIDCIPAVWATPGFFSLNGPGGFQQFFGNELRILAEPIGGDALVRNAGFELSFDGFDGPIVFGDIVPAPGAGALLALGAAGIAGRRRRVST
jgi:hypothetical protein